MKLIESLEDERLSSKINISNWKVLVDSLRASLTRETALRERTEKAEGQLCSAEKLMKVAANDLVGFIAMEQPSFDMPPEPASKADHERACLAGALQSFYSAPCPHKTEAKRLREAVEWALENGDEINLFGDNESWKDELRRRMEGK